MMNLKGWQCLMLTRTYLCTATADNKKYDFQKTLLNSVLNLIGIIIKLLRVFRFYEENCQIVSNDMLHC